MNIKGLGDTASHHQSMQSIHPSSQIFANTCTLAHQNPSCYRMMDHVTTFRKVASGATRELNNYNDA